MRLDRRGQATLVAPRRSALLLAASLAVACTSSDDTSTNTIESLPLPTSVAVDPAFFLGGVACSDQPGAMRSYVATLTDLGSIGDLGDPNQPRPTPFVLPSSPAVPCSQRTTFRYVTVDHVYVAEVDGYDVPSGDLVPVAGIASGGRAMQTRDGMRVEPRWSTACGYGDLGDEGGLARLAATYDAEVTIGGCDPLADQGGAPTVILVDPRSALGNLACFATDGTGNVTGTVTRFDILPDDASLPPFVDEPCAPDAPAPSYSVGLVGGAEYRFSLVAYEGSTVPSQLGKCFAVASEGLTVTAVCDPLVPIGPTQP
jgi:hypothetical protein